mgnify:CR=1
MIKIPTLPPRWTSRKLWLALAGAVLPPLLSYASEGVELGEALRLSAVAILGYLVAQGYVDGKAAEGWIPERLREDSESAD